MATLNPSIGGDLQFSPDLRASRGQEVSASRARPQEAQGTMYTAQGFNDSFQIPPGGLVLVS
jgi:hypothetical protein